MGRFARHRDQGRRRVRVLSRIYPNPQEFGEFLRIRSCNHIRKFRLLCDNASLAETSDGGMAIVAVIAGALARTT